MANVGHGTARQIIDSDGDVVGVTGNALDVHLKTGVASIDIGDVSLLLDGTAADYGTGNVNTSGRTLRVTLASDDVHFGTVGTAADADGTIHGQLRSISNGFTGLATQATLLSISQYIAASLVTAGAQYSETDVHTTGIVRNDTLASLATDDNDYSVLQVNADGALYVDVAAGGVLETLVDGVEGYLLNIQNATYADDADFTLNSDRFMAIGGYAGLQDITDGDVGIISLDERGQVKTVTNLGEPDTFAMLDIDNAAEQLSATIGTFSDCIEIFLQADESNSGYVIIGDSSVADNQGMKLNPGDTLILNILDTRAVYLWGSAANQNVRCMLMRSNI